ncbi:MAG: polysaccharide deacetylase family protein [Patescibacteria group bacterium]|nr:polysaccharide deacetylase family protein [Patescibacteria group bacterium]
MSTAFLVLFHKAASLVDGLFFRSPVVLTYHSVSDGKTPLSVSVDGFRAQMALLRRLGVRVLSAHDFLAIRSGAMPAPAKSVLITFDDAFQDVALNALPILEQFHFPAVVFINSGLIGGKAAFATLPWDRDRNVCSLDDLRALSGGGVAIANHSHSHKQLSELSDAEIASEYKKTFDWIEKNIGENKYPDLFVFPKGAKNERAKDVVRKAGARVLDDRIDVYADTTLLKFVLRLSPCFLWLRRNLFLIH